MFTKTLNIRAPRRGLHLITGEVARAVAESGVVRGMCNLFIQHTSASLVISENADPTARKDLEVFLDRLVPENEPYYRHTMEGPDDMPSHIKSVLTSVSTNIPVVKGELGLGTWQGIYLWEHRDHPPSRTILLSVF
ncbi:MAG TPA: secondary thiamine-phosphate synthase enzyme YjbQ [Planctomycetota bacterium]|nr:secondary thiamine-phosphate synthase enzyme YjbQ [Planctomycetota bacterium]